MNLEVLNSPAAFDHPDWSLLDEASPNRHIFSSPHWHKIWWEEFGAGKELCVLRVYDEKTIALVPLMLDLTDAGRRLRFVGGDDLTDYLGPIHADDSILSQVADVFIDFLLSDHPGWDYLDAKCLPVPFGFADRLVDSVARAGLDFSIDQDEVTSVIPLPPTFDEYLEWLRPKHRHELRRKLRKFDREVSEKAIHTATDETLTQDLAAFVNMHRGSHGLKGKFMLPERATFFRHVAQVFQPLDLLSVDFLEADGRRIASTFSFPLENTFFAYNSAYVHEARDISPGLVLVARLIRRSIERGFTRFDLLRGRERYKFDLGAEAIPLHSVVVRNKT